MTNILEAAKDLEIKRVVYSSSASIYGQLKKPEGSLVKEDDAVTIYPTYFYRASKTVSEWMGDFYKEKHGVDFVALRYSSVYGPGLYRSIPLELKKGVLGQTCKPFLTRPLDDLIYVDDVADAVSRALFANKPLSRAYNIGLDRAYTNEDLTRAIEKALPDLKFEIGQHPNAAEVAPASPAQPAGYFPGEERPRLVAKNLPRRRHCATIRMARCAQTRAATRNVSRSGGALCSDNDGFRLSLT